MCPVAHKFYSLESAYLAAHQFEQEGQCAVVLDECMGTVYPPAAIRGIRVIVFTPDEPATNDLFAHVVEPSEETEPSPVPLTALTFASVSAVTGACIWILFGVIFASFGVCEFFEGLRHLPLSEQFSWRTVSGFFGALRQAGDLVIWSGIDGFAGGAVMAPILGLALLMLKFRNTNPLAEVLCAFTGVVIIAITFYV